MTIPGEHCKFECHSLPNIDSVESLLDVLKKKFRIPETISLSLVKQKELPFFCAREQHSLGVCIEKSFSNLVTEVKNGVAALEITQTHGSNLEKIPEEFPYGSQAHSLVLLPGSQPSQPSASADMPADDGVNFSTDLRSETVSLPTSKLPQCEIMICRNDRRWWSSYPLDIDYCLFCIKCILETFGQTEEEFKIAWKRTMAHLLLRLQEIVNSDDQTNQKSISIRSEAKAASLLVTMQVISKSKDWEGLMKSATDFLIANPLPDRRADYSAERPTILNAKCKSMKYSAASSAFAKSFGSRIPEIQNMLSMLESNSGPHDHSSLSTASSAGPAMSTCMGPGPSSVSSAFSSIPLRDPNECSQGRRPDVQPHVVVNKRPHPEPGDILSMSKKPSTANQTVSVLSSPTSWPFLTPTHALDGPESDLFFQPTDPNNNLDLLLDNYLEDSDMNTGFDDL